VNFKTALSDGCYLSVALSWKTDGASKSSHRLEKMLTGGGDAVDFGIRPVSPVKRIIEGVKVESAENRVMTL
jgi:hypothetical protein